MDMVKFNDIEGIKVGHSQDFTAATGCTVIICEDGAVAGVDVRGGSPGTRETDALNPINMRQSIHAVLLSGGSAFGLDAAAGVMQYLEERGIGRDVKVAKVPIVCGAILFDFMCGDYRIRPDKKMGYDACLNTSSTNIIDGSLGAGTGATIGKVNGYEYAMKGGVGSCCFKAGDLMVGAIMAVNCVGDIYDSSSGKIIAGVLNRDKKSLGNTEEIMINNYCDSTDFFSGNTIIGVVATNAKLTKGEANKLASMSHNGIARSVRPAHTIYDGDTIFTMATGKIEANLNVVGLLAARAVECAVINAAKNSESLCGFPSYKDISLL